MSIAIMTAAWVAPGLSHTAKIVLLALADNANDAGVCWPSIPKVAERCSLDQRSVYRAIAMLEGAGHVATESRPGKPTIYRVHPVGSASGEKHYVYRTTAASGEFYIGSRTCIGDAATDSYLGSGKWVSEALARGEVLKKTIISYHVSRKEASAEETRLLGTFVGMPLCMNRRAASTHTPDTVADVPLTGCHPDRESSHQTPDTQSQTPDSVSVPPPFPPSRALPPNPPPSVRQESSVKSRAPKRARSRTVPEDFQITDAMREWARVKAPNVDVDAETEKFRDHEFRDPHSDWPAAWRQWMRRSPEFGVRGRPNGKHPEDTGWRPPPDKSAVSSAK